AQQLEAARQATEQYQDVRTAEAAGYRAIGAGCTRNGPSLRAPIRSSELLDYGAANLALRTRSGRTGRVEAGWRELPSRRPERSRRPGCQPGARENMCEPAP